MILSFPAFFTSAQDASTEATERPASLRSDEVRAGSVAAHPRGTYPGRPDGPTPRSSAARESGGPARTPYDIFFDSIKATVEAFDGR